MLELLNELAGTPENVTCPEEPFSYIETVDALDNRDACLRLLLSAGFLTFQNTGVLRVPNKLVHHVISLVALGKHEKRNTVMVRLNVFTFIRLETWTYRASCDEGGIRALLYG